MTKKNFISIVFFSVSVALFYYVLKDLKYKDFIKQSSKVEWKMVGLSAVCMILSTWFRNLRWLILFRPLGYKIKKSHALYALLLSYPANLLIPQSSFFVRASYLVSLRKHCIFDFWVIFEGEKIGIMYFYSNFNWLL